MGEKEFMCAFATDITGRKQADEALRRSESRYRTLVETIHDVVYSYSLDGRITYISPNVQTYFGYRPSEMIGHSLFEYVHPEDREAVLRDFQRTITTSEEFATYCRLMRKDGSVSHVEEIARKVVDGRGDTIGYSGVIRDITGRTQVKEAHRESEERYRAVVENSLDAVYRRDLQADRYDYMSPVIEQITGFTPEEMNTMRIDEILDRIHPDDHRSVDAELARAVASGRGIIEYRFRGKDGQYRWLADHFTVLRDREGHPLYRGGVVRDVTGRKQAEKALEDASSKLNLLTSITRHDILNQVTALKGFLALMQDPLQSTAEAEDMFRSLEKIADTIRRQITFTADYQDMGERKPEWQQVEGVIMRAAESVTLNDVSLTVDTGPLEIFADPMLEKVFFNLLDNAVIHGEQVEHIMVSFHEDGEVGVLVFEDDGAGVPASRKHKIFERGFGTVTGYGLFLVKEILDITGISIRETGEKGKGARFEIEVPAGKWRVLKN
ncbi:MAG TPA: PAS domain S-box protein [Methanoculleus sp.]|nr:PAS domain S-box protein [Methanoculleus sp.]